MKSSTLVISASILLLVAGSSVNATAAAQVPNLLPVVVNGKWGYINRSGSIVITPRWEYGGDFHDGRAVVCTHATGWFGSIPFEGTCQFIDGSGRRVGTAQPASTTADFSEGLARAVIRKKVGFVDVTGRFVIPARFDYAREFKNGFAGVRDGKKWGFVDAHGRVVVPIRYDDIDFSGFSEGFAAVKLGAKWGYVDRTGRPLVKPTYDGASFFSQGRASVKVDKSEGFIDSTGALIISPQYQIARSFSDGVAEVQQGDKWGLIDTYGKVVVPSAYDDMGIFSDGLAPVKSGQQWGFIDKTGVMRITPQFAYAEGLSEGLAPVWVGSTEFYEITQMPANGKLGYINKAGTIVIPATFDFEQLDSARFSGGIARVYEGKRWGYINRTGKYIWQPTK